MKYLLLSIILFTNFLFVNAQQDSISNWFNKYQDFRYQDKKGENYVHLIMNKVGVKKILYQYIQIDTSIIVRLFDSSENIKVILLKKDELIESIHNNLTSLKKLKQKKIENSIKKQLKNTEIFTTTIAINTKKINYNYFIVRPLDDISDPEEKVGQSIINRIEKYFIDKFKN